MAEVPYRRLTTRKVLTYTFTAECYADPALFKPWEQLSMAEQDEFGLHGSIPCEGGGVPGSWCEDCRFGEVSAFESDED